MNARSGNLNESPFHNGAPTIDSVRLWRETIDHYFTEDWEHLRTLIMQLEESIWTDDELEQQREEAALVQTMPQELLQQIAEAQSANPQMNRDAPVSSEKEGQSLDRLSDLARKIEARLQNQHGNATRSSGEKLS